VNFALSILCGGMGVYTINCCAEGPYINYHISEELLQQCQKGKASNESSAKLLTARAVSIL